MAVPAMLGHGRDARGTKCGHLNQNRSNARDFARYPDILAVHPQALLTKNP